MGTGASKEPSVSLMPARPKAKKNSTSTSTWTSKTKTPKKGNTGLTDVVRIGLSKLGFSPAEITVSKGQIVSIHWSSPLGSSGHNVRQVVFDGQAVHMVQGGYSSGLRTSDGNFDIQFNLPGEYTFISDGSDTNSGKVLHVKVNQRNYILAELTDEHFNPSVLHIQQGSWVKWAWNSIADPRSVTEVTLCPKHCGILRTIGRTSVPTQSGSYKHEFLNPGLYYFQSEGMEDSETQLCIVCVQSTQQHHCVEVTDRRFNPRLLTISQGDRVWWIWDRFKCKKKHRIQQMELPTGQTASDPFPRPVKGGFCSDVPSRAGMLSHVFQESGIYYYCDNNYEDNREYLGVVIVKPRAKEYHIEVTVEGFYPDLNVVGSGDWIWWNWDVQNAQDSFSIMQVDSCVASDTKSAAETDCNNLCVTLYPKASAILSSIGMACVQLKSAGVYHYRVSDTPATVGCCSVIVNPGQQDHCITVSDTGFDPKVLRVHPEDTVWWVWEDTKHLHNIIQVSRHGHPTKDGFCSGQPQDSPAAFVSQFSDGGVVYYQSAALPKLYGAVVAVPQAQVHQVLVSKNHLQPDPVLAQTYDCVAWVWPMLRKHGLTQLTNTQQVFELQTYTQDIVTPRRCCALRFSNPGVYHYYSKAFSNKVDKFMYEHSSKTVLSSVVVSNPSGPVMVLVSSKGFKPPAVSIHRGQSVLWSWKGSQSETHNIVHATPPTHERPYSPVTGPLAFSSGNPQPNNSFLFMFEEPGAYYETSEGAPGCVGVVNVLDNESLSAMPVITSSCNGGVVEHCHTVELQSNSESASILYTLDGSIPELHGSASRVYKLEKGIILKHSGLHIIRAIAISSGALPSGVFSSKRFWVLEGNVNTSSEDEDSVSMATDDFDTELQNHGPGPSKWQWYNCVPSISGWLHSASDSSMEIYWDLPSIPYRGELKAYELYVNGICYHNDLPPSCHSIAVEGLAGDKTYIIYVIAQPKDSTLQPHESKRLQVTCPTIYELGGPILSCQATDQDNTITLVWTSLDDLFAPGTVDYLVYVDGRERNDCQINRGGKYKTCVLTLPERAPHQAPIAVFVLAMPGATPGESDGYLSNELHLTVPLCLDNMHVLNGGSLSGKLYLTIREGSGKGPDGNTDLLPTIEQKESFDGSVSTLTQVNTPQESGQTLPSKRSLECEETFNNSRTDSQTISQEQTEMNNIPDNPTELDIVSNACKVSSVAGPLCTMVNSNTVNTNIDPPSQMNHNGHGTASKQVENGDCEQFALQVSNSQNCCSDNCTDANFSCGKDNSQAQELDKSVQNEVSNPKSGEINPQLTSQNRKGSLQDENHKDKTSIISVAAENQTQSNTEEFLGFTENQNKNEKTSNKDSGTGISKIGNTPQNSIDSCIDKVQNEDHGEDICGSVLHEDNLNPCCDVTTMHADNVSSKQVHVMDYSQVHDSQIMLHGSSDGSSQQLVDQCTLQDGAEDCTASHIGDIALHASGKELSNLGGSDSDSGKNQHGKVVPKEDEVSLPSPVVSIRSQPTNAELHIQWRQTAAIQHTQYTLHHYSVCVQGSQFDIPTHSRQDVFNDDTGKTETQHSWNAGRGQVFVPSGLTENTTYRVTVHAMYHHKQQDLHHVIKRSSKAITCTTGGKPQPPQVMIKAIGLQEVTLSWLPGRCHEDIDVVGYQLTHNGKPNSEMIAYGKMETGIKNLQPGTKHYFTVCLVTTTAGQTNASNLVTVICPEIPEAPIIKQENSSQGDGVVIVWPRQRNKQLTLYRVSVNGKLHGEVKAKLPRKHTHHKYVLRNLKIKDGCQYSVVVKASVSWEISGLQSQDHRGTIVCTFTNMNSQYLFTKSDKELDAYAGSTSIKKDHTTEASCGILSAESNHLTIVDTSTSLQVSLELRVECIHAGGIDVAWAVTDADKIDTVKGFILLKDGHPDPVGILPGAVTKATLSDIQSGSTLTIQVLALTQSVASTREQSLSSEQIEKALRMLPPNSVLRSDEVKVDYGCLVQAPSRVWCELVTGHSFVAVWDPGQGNKPGRRQASAENYIVTWRKVSETSTEPALSQTSDDHLLIDGLDVGTEYCITVQARGKHTQRSGYSDSTLSEYDVPVLSGNQSLNVTTASPPEPPSKLTTALVSSNTVQLTWRPPREKGAEVRGLRIYVTMLHDNRVMTLQHMDLLPDATSAIIKHLQESTSYTLHLVTITDEFLYQANVASSEQCLRNLPEDWDLIPKDSLWLPCVSIDVTTEGALPPSNLRCDFGEDGVAVLMWTAPEYDGRMSTVRKYELQWTQVKHNDVTSSSDPYIIEIPNDRTSCHIPDLVQGNDYCFTVSAVISEQDSNKTSKRKFKKRSRAVQEELTRLASEPYIVRVPAPCIAPDVIITGFGPAWLDLYWKKPLLMTAIKDPDDPVCSKCIRRILLGYRLQLNGTTHAYLQPNTQQYRLQCTEAQSYQVVLAAITTTDRSLSRKLISHSKEPNWLESSHVSSQCDVAMSKPVCFTLPKQQSGNIVKLTAKFCPSGKNNQDADKKNHLQGDIHVEWLLQQEHGTADEQGIVGYDVTWSSSVDGEERVTRLGQTATSYDIPVYHNGCLYDLTVRANQYDDMWQDESYPRMQCIVPGPPDPPTLCCTMARQDEFILEWGEPKMYGGAAIRGYQVYMNGRKIGQELSASHYKAAIPCRPNRTYHMSIMALSADPNYRDSDLSEEVVITCWSPKTDPQDPSKGYRAEYRGQGDGCCVPPPPCPEDISVAVQNVTETSVTLEWRLPLIGLESQDLVKTIRVAWSSVAKPQELEALMQPCTSQYTLSDCTPGTNHFMTVTALDECNRVLHRSRQLTVQTTAQLMAPQLGIRSCTYSGCILEWDKPVVYGNAQLAGYRLQLNSKDHDLLPAGTSSYLFTSGKMCKEYAFTIQALCTIAHLHSPISEPARVTWPGAVPPTLHRTTTNKLNAIKVTWSEPKVNGGVKVQHYKVTCIEESSTSPKSVLPTRPKLPKTHGPLSPDQRSAEFLHLSPHAAYTILLETHVSGIGKAIRSRSMKKQYAARRPAPPSVKVTIKGLEERRALEVEACQLVNMRHRILQDLISYQQGTSTGQPLKMEHGDNNTAEVAEALSTLAEIEDQLFQVLETLLPYTGTVSVDLEWQTSSSSNDVSLLGFKILVNGKQRGFDLHAKLNRISVQLNAYDGVHEISVVAVTDHPVGNSDPSVAVMVDASPFLPFTCYCLHTVHRNGCRHPQDASCSYQQTLAQEVCPQTPSILTGLHQSLADGSRRIPPASVSVIDVFDGVSQLLIPTKPTSNCPTLLLFWTHWCLASQKTMNHFVQYARRRAGQVACIACCCNSTKLSNPTHLQESTTQISMRGWRDDDVIRHTCCCNVSDMGLMPGSRQGSASSDKGKLSRHDDTAVVKSSPVISVPELFGVLATPTIIVLHPEGYMAWQGCYAACDHSSFSIMMDETIDSVMKTTWMASTHSNTKVVSPSTEVPLSSLPVIQSSSNRQPDDAPPSRSSSVSTPSSQLSGSARRVKSAVQQRKYASRRKVISVNNRPFTAGSTNGKADSAGLF